MKKTFAIYPYLFAIFPILFLYSHNIELLPMISFSKILIPIAIILGFTIISMVFLWLIFKKDGKKAAIVVSIFLVLFFSYGRIYDPIKGFKIGDVILGGHRYLLFVWLILFILGTYFTVKTKKDLRNLTNIINVITIVLILFPLSNIGIYKFNTRDSQADTGAVSMSEETIITGNTADLPDVYYIILDGYASVSSLEEFYDYDNHEFINFLTEKGFYIASNSRSNYPWTTLSITSALSMEYINYLGEEIGLESNDRTIPYQMISNSNVWKFLKSKGYQFVHFNSSGWGPTDSNRFADISIRANRLNEFNISLIQTTMLKPLEKYIIIESGAQKVLYSLSNLGKVNQIDGPKYIFAHIMSPHPPFFFDANGELIPKAEYKLAPYWDPEKYLDQLIFINSRVELLVEEILSNSKIPPIIIIQGDHGARSTIGEPDPDKPADHGWEYPTAENLRESTYILNAYYLPGNGSDLLYDSITPVNSFRVVFNTYFDEDFELLEDKIYYSVYKTPFDFFDVTEIKDYTPTE